MDIIKQGEQAVDIVFSPKDIEEALKQYLYSGHPEYCKAWMIHKKYDIGAVLLVGTKEEDEKSDCQYYVCTYRPGSREIIPVSRPFDFRKPAEACMEDMSRIPAYSGVVLFIGEVKDNILCAYKGTIS